MLNTQQPEDQVLNCVKPLSIQTRSQKLMDTAYSQQSRPIVTACEITQKESLCLSIKTKACSSSPKKCALNSYGPATISSENVGQNGGTNQINKNLTQMSLWASPSLISIDNNQNVEVSPKIRNFMNQSDNAEKRHSNFYLTKSENTDLKKSQSFSLNQITVDNSHFSNRPSKTFNPKIIQQNVSSFHESRPANLSRSAQNLSSDNKTYIPRPNGAVGPLAGRLTYHQPQPVANIFVLAGSDQQSVDKVQRKSSFEINDVTNISSSFKSFDSPQNAEKFQNLLDLTDLTADLNEFNKFYNTRDCTSYSKIERPQNPFDKNFEINKSRSDEIKRKSSFSETDDSRNLLNQNYIPGLKTRKCLNNVREFRRFELLPVENLQRQNNFCNQNKAESDVQSKAQLSIAFED